VHGEPTVSPEICECAAFDLFLAVVSLPHEALWAFFLCLVDSHTVNFPFELAVEHELPVPDEWLRKPGSVHANAQLLLDVVLFFLPRWIRNAQHQRLSRCLLPVSVLPNCRRLRSYLAGARIYVSELWGLGEDDVSWEDEWRNNIGSFLIDFNRARCYGNDYYTAAAREHDEIQAEFERDYEERYGRYDGQRRDDPMDYSGSSDDYSFSESHYDQDHLTANLRHLSRLQAGEYGDLDASDYSDY
jgi:hypothetical protein